MQLQIPRCFDHHNHFSLYLSLASCPSLDDVDRKDDALRLIAAGVREGATLFTGWHSDRFALGPDDIMGLPPVVVINYCLHGYVMNAAAAETASSAGFPVAPSSHREAELLMSDVLAFFGRMAVPRPNAVATMRDLLRRQGLYGVEDMLYVPWAADSRRDGGADDDVFRVESWVPPNAWPGPDTRDIPGFRGFKLFADGAVGSRTAAISDGFVSEGWPVLTHSDAGMDERFAWCFDNLPPTGGVSVHAIGDLAISQVLDSVSRVAARPGSPSDLPARVRIEHAQFVTFAQAMQARELSVTLSMQPNFSEDSVIYADRLHRARAAGNNPFRMLIDEAGFTPGRDLLFGSDGMPHGLAPAMRNAIFPPLESQRLSLDELLAGYSADRGFGTVTVDVDESSRTVSLVQQGPDCPAR